MGAIAVLVALLIAGLVLAALVIAKRLRAVATARAVAEDCLWRRYNIAGDLIPVAASQGAPETQDRFDAVMAARIQVMKARGDAAVRFAAEDELQRALNAYYEAAYRDDELLAEHETVMILAHLIKADARAFEACRAHDRAAKAFRKAIALSVPPAPPPAA